MSTKLNLIRGLHSDFARAYKYDFIIIKESAAMSSSSFKLNQGTKENLRTSCLNVVLPNEGVQLIEVEVGSHTLKLHGRKEKGGTISPEFILTGDYAIYKYFRLWQNAANPDNMISGEVQTVTRDLLANIHITAKDITNASAITLELQNCWCRNAPEINFNDDSNDIVRWSPEIVYEFSHIIDPTTQSSIT